MVEPNRDEEIREPSWLVDAPQRHGVIDASSCATMGGGEDASNGAQSAGTSDDNNDDEGAEDSDRRIHERYPARIAVDVQAGRPTGDHFLFAYIENISEMGIFVRTDEPLAVGTALTLRFDADDSRMELDGVVAWVNPVREDGDNPNPGMGVHFHSLGPDDRERLVELVRAVAYLNSD